MRDEEREREREKKRKCEEDVQRLTIKKSRRGELIVDLFIRTTIDRRGDVSREYVLYNIVLKY